MKALAYSHDAQLQVITQIRTPSPEYGNSTLLPGTLIISKDWELIRVWQATSFKKRDTESSESQLDASVELDGKQTKDMMCLAGI